MIANGLFQVSNRLRADELNIILKGENAISYFKISFMMPTFVARYAHVSVTAKWH